MYKFRVLPAVAGNQILVAKPNLDQQQDLRAGLVKILVRTGSVLYLKDRGSILGLGKIFEPGFA